MICAVALGAHGPFDPGNVIVHTIGGDFRVQYRQGDAPLWGSPMTEEELEGLINSGEAYRVKPVPDREVVAWAVRGLWPGTVQRNVESGVLWTDEITNLDGSTVLLLFIAAEKAVPLRLRLTDWALEQAEWCWGRPGMQAFGAEAANIAYLAEVGSGRPDVLGWLLRYLPPEERAATRAMVTNGGGAALLVDVDRWLAEQEEA